MLKEKSNIVWNNLNTMIIREDFTSNNDNLNNFYEKNIMLLILKNWKLIEDNENNNEKEVTYNNNNENYETYNKDSKWI